MSNMSNLCSYDEQAFNNLSEESENNNFIVKKSLRPVLSQDMVEQAKRHGSFRPQQGYPGNVLKTREWSGRGSPDEGYN